MRKFIFIIFLLACVLILALVFYRPIEEKPLTNTETVTTFNECVEAGYLVQEKYPRTCVDNSGNSFEENIGNVMDKQDLIILESPLPNATVLNPIQVKGEARGYWFFEGTFPIVVVNWDGLIIGEGFATAQEEWMTENFVPFTATISYNLNPDSYSKNGSLILHKNNPSGLPENDDALEIPIVFE